MLVRETLGRHLPFAALLGGLFACLYLVTARGQVDNIDTRARLEVARAICEHGDPGLDERLDLRWVTVVGRHAPRVAHYGLGHSLLGLPLIVASRRLLGFNPDVEEFAFVLIDPLCAAAAVLVYALVLLLLGYRRRTVLAASLVLGGASCLWPAAQSSSEAPQVVLLLLLLVLAVVLRGVSAGPGPLLLAGAAMGWLGLTRETDAVAALPLLCALLWARPASRGERLRAGILVALAGAPFLAAFLAYNLWRYGSFSPHVGRLQILHDMGVPVLGNPLRALIGLLASPGKGILFYSPVVVLGALGFPSLHRRHRPLGVAVPLVFLLTVLTIIPLLPWHGDYNWGPRYLLGAAPLLLLGVPFTLEHFWVAPRQHPLVRPAILLLLVLSTVIQLAAVTVSYRRYYRAHDLRHVFYARNQEPYFNPSLSPILYHLESLPAVVADTVVRLRLLPRVPPKGDLDRTELLDTAPFYWVYFELASHGRLRTPARLSAGLLAAGTLGFLLLALRRSRAAPAGG